jgi:chemotaxis signal transduction protein
MTGLHDIPRRASETRSVSPVAAPTRLLVVGRIGGQRFAWPAACVERVLPMAALTTVVDLPPDVAGLLDLQGETLAVVDPRPRLGLPIQAARPEQHLLVISLPGRRYLLWVDSIEDVVAVDSPGPETAPSDGAPVIARYDGQLVQVLSPSTFDPGRVVQGEHDPQ